MPTFLAGLLSLATILFAVSSTATVGLGSTVREIVGPLRSSASLGVLANFVLVPALAYLLSHLLNLDRDHQLGLILVACAAGAPLQIKLTQIAGGNTAYSAGLLVLLLAVTIVYMPLVVPLEVPQADVSPTAIATPLILSMLLPLSVGLLLKAKRPRWAVRVVAIAGKTASISLYALIALTVVLHVRSVLGLFGTGAVLASALLIGGAFVIGYVLRGFRGQERGEAALATAQRNYAAAMVVAAQSFEQSPNVLVMVVAMSLVSMALLFPAAHLLARRAQRHAPLPNEPQPNEPPANEAAVNATQRPNILVLCMDQWDTHMDVPSDVRFPAMQRMQSRGVTFDRQYCTVPICTPSRASMWTGVHAKATGLWDNTNFAWIDELSSEFPTIGHMLREQGYYSAFKGKWHCSEVPLSEDALERYGFSDFQQWGEMFGTPLQGEMLDGTAVNQTIDWLEHRRPQLDQPWLLVCSLVNPHDIMYLQTDPIETPHPEGAMMGKQSTVQRLDWFQQNWEVALPANFADDYALQPPAVQHYKDFIDEQYGRVPDDRTDLWLVRRNYLVNAMRLVDAEFLRVLETLDRLDLWKNTVVIFTSDHGEMNAAHRMTQKGAIHFDEAAIVNLTVCTPGGPQGKRTAAVGSHLDLAPTILAFAGLTEPEIHDRYPHLKGRSQTSAILNPEQHGPRGSVNAPGDGALYCWDGLYSLDHEWAISGALRSLTDLKFESADPEQARTMSLRRAGEKYGAPDFTNRTFFRCVVDGQYKLVRWFSPVEYGNPATLEELLATGDVTLHDLVNDPGELENIGHPHHPAYDPALVERMLGKLHALVAREIGEDHAPFDLDLFGTREVKHRRRDETAIAAD